MAKSIDDFAEELRANIANAQVRELSVEPTVSELITAAQQTFSNLFAAVSKFDGILREKFGDKAAIQIAMGTNVDTKARIVRGNITFDRVGVGQKQIQIAIQGDRIWFDDPAFQFSHGSIYRRDYDHNSIDDAIGRLLQLTSAFFA